MKVSYVKKLMLLGISTRTNNANEKDKDTQKIAPLWEKFDVENTYSKILNKANNTSFYGVYSNYESDVNGDYDATVALEVTKSKNNAMVKENKKYLVFTKQGDGQKYGIILQIIANMKEHMLLILRNTQKKI